VKYTTNHFFVKWKFVKIYKKWKPQKVRKNWDDRAWENVEMKDELGEMIKFSFTDFGNKLNAGEARSKPLF